MVSLNKMNGFSRCLPSFTLRSLGEAVDSVAMTTLGVRLGACSKSVLGIVVRGADAQPGGGAASGGRTAFPVPASTATPIPPCFGATEPKIKVQLWSLCPRSPKIQRRARQQKQGSAEGGARSRPAGAGRGEASAGGTEAPPPCVTSVNKGYCGGAGSGM